MKQKRTFDIDDLRNRTHVFRDRTHSGEVLASLLCQHKEDSGIVLAIPSGGVPVALEVAEKLNLPLDLMIVSKITLSWNTEAGYGAVAYDGTCKLNEELVSELQLSTGEIQSGIERTRKKVEQRLSRLRKLKPAAEIAGETVILVDDGLASGFTMHVAVEAARKIGARRIVVAVPTGHESGQLSSAADAVYCANMRSGPSFAVADAYHEWYDLSDEEVLHLLSQYENPK